VIKNILKKLKSILWKDLSIEDFKKFGMLSLTLLFIVGIYWLMKPLKESIFVKVVGRFYLPYVKIASFGFIIPLVLGYSKLVDMFEKQKLFYVICACYSIIFFLAAFALAHPTIGLANTHPSPTRIIGWIIYLFIESFASLLVALFWSFVISNTDTKSAKHGYALIISGAQIGTILGPFIATKAPELGIVFLTFLVSAAILIIPVLVKIFILVYPCAAETHIPEKQKTGPLEGLKLLLSKRYLLGILGVATLFEIIATIVEYQMIFLADSTYPVAEQVTQFMGYFGLATNSLALSFALIGTSFLIRKFGLTFCLVAYPTIVGIVMIKVWALPSLWIFFVAAVIIKGLSYALNIPCKEIMYIPTSKNIKFKTKSWIDMFGSRSAKALGSVVNTFFTNIQSMLFFAPLISLGIIGFWISVALYVGKTNKHLTDNNLIIE